jgi:hypothetical protein
LARLREVERLALLRLADLRPPDRADFRVLFRADPRRPRLADFRAALAADPRLPFFAPLRADFLPLPFAARVDDFFLALPLARVVPSRLGAGSSKSNEDGDEAGVGEGVLSEGSGSIHPEPDQPISI